MLRSNLKTDRTGGNSWPCCDTLCPAAPWSPRSRQPPRPRLALGASRAAGPGILRAPALLAASAPDKFVLAYHVTISPAWFDPSTAPPQITPCGVLYALHDALVRAYPGAKMGPELAEECEESEDGLTYEFNASQHLTGVQHD